MHRIQTDEKDAMLCKYWGFSCVDQPQGIVPFSLLVILQFLRKKNGPKHLLCSPSCFLCYYYCKMVWSIYGISCAHQIESATRESGRSGYEMGSKPKPSFVQLEDFWVCGFMFSPLPTPSIRNWNPFYQKIYFLNNNPCRINYSLCCNPLVTQMCHEHPLMRDPFWGHGTALSRGCNWIILYHNCHHKQDHDFQQ